MWRPLIINRDRDRSQTCNLLIRSQMLYSVELRSHFFGAGGKYRTNIKKEKIEKRPVNNRQIKYTWLPLQPGDPGPDNYI